MRSTLLRVASMKADRRVRQRFSSPLLSRAALVAALGLGDRLNSETLRSAIAESRHGAWITIAISSGRTVRRAAVEHRRLCVFGDRRQRTRLLQAGPGERGADDRALLVRDPALLGLEVARVDSLASAMAAAAQRRSDGTVWVSGCSCVSTLPSTSAGTRPVPDRLRQRTYCCAVKRASSAAVRWTGGYRGCIRRTCWRTRRIARCKRDDLVLDARMGQTTAARGLPAVHPGHAITHDHLPALASAVPRAAGTGPGLRALCTLRSHRAALRCING